MLGFRPHFFSFFFFFLLDFPKKDYLIFLETLLCESIDINCIYLYI